jgi:hypothetical protein
VLQTASYRGLAVTFRGFEPVTRWRPSLPLADYMVVVRELLRDVVARAQPRFTIIGGFSSGADFAMRLVPRPIPTRAFASMAASRSERTCPSRPAS